MKLSKTLAVAALATLIVAPQAFAAGASCSRPNAVKVPDGGTAEEGAMKTANTQVVAYIKDMNAYIKCLRDEETSAANEAKKTNDDYQAAVKAFNSTPAK